MENNIPLYCYRLNTDGSLKKFIITDYETVPRDINPRGSILMTFNYDFAGNGLKTYYRVHKDKLNTYYMKSVYSFNDYSDEEVYNIIKRYFINKRNDYQKKADDAQSVLMMIEHQKRHNHNNNLYA